MFDDDYLDRLPSDSLAALSQITTDISNRIAATPSVSERIEDIDTYLEAYSVSVVLMNNLNDIYVDGVAISGGNHEILNRIILYFSKLNIEISQYELALKMASFNSKHSARFGNQFAYAFSDGDLSNLQRLINELREIISKSDLFEEEHRLRMIARLERMQSELHKKMSDLDRFWGLIGDAGVAIGKFGNDAKPIVDRIREMTQIVCRTQSISEGLSSDIPTPMLGHDDSVGKN